MSHKITKDQLQKIMETMSPEEIRRDYQHRLGEDARAYFQAFQTLAEALDRMHARMSQLLPPPPRMPTAALQRRPKRPWWRQQWAFPAWAIVTVLVLALTSPILSSLQAIRSIRSTSEMEYRSPPPPDRDRTPLDNALFDSALKRGIYFYEKEGRENHRRALRDFQIAQSILPKHPRVLEYLALIHDALGNQAEAESFLDRIRKTEDDLP